MTERAVPCYNMSRSRETVSSQKRRNTIEIKTPEQAEKINLLASKAPYEVWLSTDTVMLDARSLLGLLSLVGQRVRVVAEDNVNPKRFSRLVDRME